MYKITNSGFLEVICGPMFSGKTTELVRRVERSKIAGIETKVFKPVIDNRYDEENIVCHNELEIKAKPVESLKEVLKYVDSGVVVGLDEIQFFDEKELLDTINVLVDHNCRVIAAGLDLDFRGEPFEPTVSLMAQAEYVNKLRAVCKICGEPASRTQRIIDGLPASYDDARIVVGSDERYEARCREHHIVEREED